MGVPPWVWLALLGVLLVLIAVVAVLLVRKNKTFKAPVSAPMPVIENSPAEPAPKSEPTPTATPQKTRENAPASADGVSERTVDGEVVLVRYRSSFMSRYIQSDAAIQDYYGILKNTLLSYKGVKARVSWNCESYGKARVQLAKINIKGRSLVVNLALDPKDYIDSKYHFTDCSDKPKLLQVPMMIKVRSDRALKYALELITEMMAKLEIEFSEQQNVDYSMPYETTEALVAKELVKVILPRGMKLDENANVVKADVTEMLEIARSDDATPEKTVTVSGINITLSPLHLDAAHADALLSDEEAAASVEVVRGKTRRTGKMCEINLDTICEAFSDGECVTLEALSERRLIGRGFGRVKVLARGVMDKSLTVRADKFSLQAVKMITLAGGHAEVIK